MSSRNNHYAYPPFPGAPLKSVYERAGFEVNKEAFYKPKHRSSSRSTPRNGSLPSLSSNRLRSSSQPGGNDANSNVKVHANTNVSGYSHSLTNPVTEGLGITNAYAASKPADSRRSSKPPSLYHKSEHDSATSVGSNGYPITPVSPDDFNPQPQQNRIHSTSPQRSLPVAPQHEQTYPDPHSVYSEDSYSEHYADHGADLDFAHRDASYPVQPPAHQNYSENYSAIPQNTAYHDSDMAMLAPPGASGAEWRNSTASSVYSDSNDVIGRNSVMPQRASLSPTRPLSLSQKTSKASNSDSSYNGIENSSSLDYQHSVSTSTAATSVHEHQLQQQQQQNDESFRGSHRTSSDTFYDILPNSQGEAEYYAPREQNEELNLPMDVANTNVLANSYRHAAPAPLMIQPNAYPSSSLDALPSPTPSKMSSRICRGCNQFITGKCVSAKDGQISGRWHKQCFACTKCHDSLSNEFYVLQDSPFCQQCYHEENRSICTTCSIGIEGECLESFSQDDVNYSEPLRYHPQCLVCTDCGTLINLEEYCTVNGHPVCSEHVQQNGYGTCLIERRKSRFMFM